MMARYFVELTCLVLLIVVIYTLHTGEPNRRGFWCHDETIRYPLEDLIIGLRTIVTTSLVLVPIIIIANETMLLKSVHASNELSKYLFGFFINVLVMLGTKFAFGRLRPHFIAVCNPEINCDEPQNQRRYITDYVCRNPNFKQVSQARQSFFSGHASIGLFTGLFLAGYIMRRCPPFGLTRVIIQITVICIGLVPGLTQVNNYWHHWSDVLTGYIVGGFFALLVQRLDYLIHVNYIEKSENTLKTDNLRKFV